MKISASIILITSLLITPFAEARLNLKLSHNQNRQHPVHQSMQFFADRVQQLTNGEIRIRIYPDAQLGEQRESIEQVQNGAIEMAKSNAAELEAFHGDYGAFNYPYLFNDRDQYYTVLLSDVGKKILHSSKDKGFIGIAYYDGGARSFYAKKPILSPADLKGLKVRVQPSPTAIEMLKIMGAHPTPLSFSELYTALQQGVVDAAENNLTALTLSRHGEVTKFFSLDEHTMIPDVLVMSTKIWNKLSTEHQNAIEMAARESTLKMRELWDQSMQVEREKAEKMGVQFMTVDKKAFQEAVAPMFEALRNSQPNIYNLVEQMRAVE